MHPQCTWFQKRITENFGLPVIFVCWTNRRLPTNTQFLFWQISLGWWQDQLTVFTILDLYKSYHQIRFAPEAGHKTAMITLFGNYAFKRLTMDFKSAGNTFCRFMHEVLRGVPNCFVYINDIMIFFWVRRRSLEASFKGFQPLRAFRPHFEQGQMRFRCEGGGFSGTQGWHPRCTPVKDQSFRHSQLSQT